MKINKSALLGLLLCIGMILVSFIVASNLPTNETPRNGYTESYLESRRIADLLNAKLQVYPPSANGCPLAAAMDEEGHLCYSWYEFKMPVSPETEYKNGYLAAYYDGDKVNYYVSKFGNAPNGYSGYFVTALNPMQYARLKGHGVPEY